MYESSLLISKAQINLRNVSKFLSICLLLIALFAPAAQAETVFVNPGAVGGAAQDFWFEAGPAAFVDIVWTDNKTLEYTSGTHLFFLFGPPCDNYAGILLDAAGNPIPDTELVGSTLCTAGSDLSAGVIDLQTATVFSGIRLISSGFGIENYAWQWTWEEDEKPVVGQTESSSNQPPVPNAGGPYEGVAGTPITFDASGSSDPDGTITTYTWDFGDNVTFGGETINHTYASAGTYNVTLTVTDDGGVSQSTRTTANIGNNSLRPTADAGGPYEGTVGQAVTFDGGGSTDDGTIATYAWDFGAGTGVIETMNTTIQHTYGAAGTYTVVLTVTDNTGNTDVADTTATMATGNQPPEADAGPPTVGAVGSAVTFDGSNSSDADGPIAQYAWDFGDNSDIDTLSGANPSHTYAAAGDYTVVLTVTDGDGVKDSASTAASIDANPLPPKADAGPPADGTAGVAVDFDGSGSADSDGNIVTYAWDFGDGSAVDTVSGANPSHTYAAAGSYTVTLTVTDNDTLTDTDTTQAAIDQANTPPTADAGGLYAAIVNQPVILAGADSSDGDGDIVQYDWDFGDGSPVGSGLYVSHTYTASGLYEVTLTVMDDGGDTDESTASVIVVGGAIQPPRVFTTGPYNGVAGVPLPVDGSNSSDPDGIINTYDWAFGDGNSGTGPMPVHTYTASGLYAVTLQVTDNDGFPASGSTIAHIGNLSLPPRAVATPNYEPYQGRVGVPVSFNGGNSSDTDGTINRYDWTFGDDVAANDAGPTPLHTYAASGKYVVTLAVTDDSGETDMDVTFVNVGVGNLPPTSHAGESIVTVAGVATTFDGFESNDPDGSIESFEWNFGDDTTDTGEIATHTYSIPGTYIATLSVTDNDGASSSDAVVVSVLDPSEANPPTKPILRTPGNGSIVDLGPDGSTTLRWSPSIDPNGGDVNYEVYLCTDESPLTRCPAIEVASYLPPGNGTTLYASVVPVNNNSEKSSAQIIALLGAVICIGLTGFSWSRRKKTMLYILLAFSLSAFMGCDGGGGGGTRSVTYEATGLSPGTTYYWAVVAEDDQGEESASDVWSFTTR